MNLALAACFADLRLHLTTDFHGPGTHDWPYWERELHRSLPMLLGALRRGH
jgi:diacylglycerol O-acyltransferase/trehalose O-mycolyltransferase